MSVKRTYILQTAWFDIQFLKLFLGCWRIGSRAYTWTRLSAPKELLTCYTTADIVVEIVCTSATPE